MAVLRALETRTRSMLVIQLSTNATTVTGYQAKSVAEEYAKRTGSGQEKHHHVKVSKTHHLFVA